MENNNNINQTIANLSAEKRALLALKLKNKHNQNTNTSTYQSIPLIKNGDRTLLSFAQQRLWFLDRLKPNSSFYNIPGAIRLKGELNISVLQQALDAIVAHHEILRTNYISENGNPIQVINPPQSVELQIIDLQQYEGTEQETQLQKILHQETQRPFNLSSDMMLRFCLLQLAPQEYMLLLVMHHIASDGWSIGIFWEQLTQLYQAFLAGKPNPLLALPIQYADYAVWQKQWLTGEVLDKQLNYWKQQLAGANPVLELPTDRPRPAAQSYRGASRSVVIPSTLTKSLKQLCSQQGVTLYMTLLAAFQILLYRYSRQEDIIVGSPIAGRNRAEIEALIGFFVNTLVIRTDLSGNPSFCQLLERLRSITLDAYNHQDLPFEKLVEELQPERSLSYNPLFQVMFVLQNTPKQADQLLGLTATPVQLETATAKFDLTLSVIEQDGVLIGSWEYNTDLFDAATIERMTAHFQTLLEGIVDNPQQSISQLPLLSQAERQQLLVEWNDTYPQHQFIHQLFEEQVERTPDAIALHFEGQQLTYAQLNARANQLAHYLQSLGVTPEVLVGLCVERSIETIIGILGILKAGGAYLPLDPAYPQERLQYMLSDSGVGLLLTTESCLLSLPKHSAQVVRLDIEWETIARESQENFNAIIQLSNLAYVIYTSGSTGKPKGVLVTHQGIVNLAIAQADIFGITANSSILQFASFSFDASISEVAMTLCSGARLCLAKRESLLSGVSLVKLLRQKNITHVTIPPSVLAVLPYEELPNLEGIIVAGEACPAELVAKWSQGRRFFNAYGPTEATVCATIAECQGTVKPSIGRPIANSQIYLLDRHLQPVPIGIPGEIYIGSIGLARGYLNRPELTAEKFISNPFSQDPEARLYRTGDLARYLVNGEIEYLGRIDSQVKMRGFRIELGEVEAAILSHPLVSQATVIAREDRPGEKRLVAYVAIEPQAELTVNELRNTLKQNLPEYMIATDFVFLDVLPVTPNGKIDRKALPKPDRSRQDESSFVAPRDQIEAELSKIWANVLGIESVGVLDNFFELGGHSLQAMHLFAQIQQKFDRDIPVATLFQAPTIENLANIIRQQDWQPVRSSIVQVQPGKSGEIPFFIVVPGATTALPWFDLARYLGSDRPVYCLQALNSDTESENPNSIEEIATRYVEEMLTQGFDGPYLLGGRCGLGAVVAFEVAVQLQAKGKQVDLLAMLDPTYEAFRMAFVEPEPQTKSLQYYLDRIVYHWQRGQFLDTARRKIPFLKTILPETIAIEQSSDEDNDNNNDALVNAPDAMRLQALLNSQKAAYRKYIPQALYQGQMTLILSEYRIKFGLVRYENWHKLCTEGFARHIVPGHHSNMLDDPYVQFLAEKLNECIDQAIASTDGN